MTCEACEARVYALYMVWDRYSVCENCIDNYDMANEDISLAIAHFFGGTGVQFE